MSLGSNLGDRQENLRTGLEELERLLSVECRSGVYETRPEGRADQPAFLNMCVTGVTDLEPRALLRALQSIEYRAGRRRPDTPAGHQRSGPRTLDLDLLLYGRQVHAEPGLNVPHPRMDRRSFVLIPLAEIASEWTVPGTGRSVGGLALEVGSEGVERCDDELLEDV